MSPVFPEIQPVQYSIGQVLQPYFAVFVIACLVAGVMTPIMRTLALRNGIVDWPDLKRKQHREPVAYLGGVAIFLGWAAGVTVSLFTTPHTTAEGVSFIGVHFPPSVLIGALLITVIGLIDDVYGSVPRVKIGGQILAAAMLAGDTVGTKLASGVIASSCNVLGLDPGIVPGFRSEIIWYDPSYYLGTVLVVVLVVGGCNAANLLDGLDGLVSGVTGIVAAGFLFIVVSLAMGLYNGQAYSSLGDPVRIVITLSLLGAVLGFLPFNFHPAKIFMGDAGSMLVGYLCVSIILLLAEKGDTRLVMAAMVVFAVPIIDTLLAIIRRKSKGQPIFSPDNFHLHHQLVRAGYTVPKAVGVLYLMSVAFAVLGCSMIFLQLRFVASVFLLVMGSILVIAYKVGHRQYLAVQALAGAASLTSSDTQNTPEPLESPTLSPGASADPSPAVYAKSNTSSSA